MLTQNRMTVQHAWYDNKVYFCPAGKNIPDLKVISEPGQTPDGEPFYDQSSEAFQRLLQVATLCNNAEYLTKSEDGSFIDLKAEMMNPNFNILKQPATGDTSEQGLLKLVQPLNDALDTRAKYPKLFEIKFNSTNKWQLSIHGQPGGRPPLLVLKGAPERVLAKCTSYFANGKTSSKDAEFERTYTQSYEDLGGRGERVLGFAFKELSGFKNDFKFSQKPKPNFPIDDLTFVGLFSLIDPPREGVPEAVTKCNRARIKVYMVTGDHPITAAAIAKQVNIVSQENLDNGTACVVKGDDIRAWTEIEDPVAQRAKWDAALDHKQIVWARVSPAHKLLIVENCQRRGEIVAVTGDGVNDAPALKKGDIGIAMGIAGKDVSKEAADMILLDDNFASIVNGVEEGRLIFDNLKKSIAYTLSSNIPEISPFLSFITVGIPLPLSTVLILCIDLGTDMVPAISMAWEDKEADIMKRLPRDQKKDRLVTKKLVCFAYLQIGVIQAVAGFYSYMVVMGDYGYYSHTLPGLGADDAWQKVQLMCKVEGGVLRNEDGYAYPDLNDFSGDKNYAKINDAFAKGYMFWDWNTVDRSDPTKQIKGYKAGEVITCAHAPRSINNDKMSKPTDYDWSNPKTYENNNLMIHNNFTRDESVTHPTSYTAGRPVTAVNTIIAMKKAGWIEYLPFAARMSAFYDKNWAYWEPRCKSSTDKCDKTVAGDGEQKCCGSVSGISGVATIQGYGDASADAYFAGTPAGYRVLPKWSKQVSGTAVYPSLVTDSIIKGEKSDSYWIGGMKIPKTKDGSTTSWQNDLFDMPRYDDITELTKDYNSTEVEIGTKACTSWTLTDTSVTSHKKTNCLQATSGLADNMYSWYHGAKVRVNVMNRMLQREALAFAQTSGFTTIIVVQWADLMICKTRWLSIRQQGMSNPLMNFGLLFETILGACVCFVPFLNAALQTRPLRFTHWMPGMPFMVIIFLYDEIRKYLMRTGSTDTVDPQTGQVTKNFNWVGENTYY